MVVKLHSYQNILLVKVLNWEPCAYAHSRSISKNSCVEYVCTGTAEQNEHKYGNTLLKTSTFCTHVFTVIWYSFDGGKKRQRIIISILEIRCFFHVITKFIGSYRLAKINLFITCRHFMCVCVCVRNARTSVPMWGFWYETTEIVTTVAFIEDESSWLLWKLSSESSLSFMLCC